MSTRLTANHTIIACFIGYIVQAVVNNFAPLLFLTFQSDYGVPLGQIAMLTAINFTVQLVTDAVSPAVIKRVGYRAAAVTAHFLAAAGILLMAFLPEVMPPFAGLLLASCIYAVGGGLIEVIISPIVQSCPGDKKEAAMSLLHSFYCWGHLGVVLISSGFFALFGTGHWQVLAVIWAALPVFNLFFFLRVPMYSPEEDGEGGMGLRGLFGQKIFWVLLLLMFCAGSSEQAMSQWASAFAESALGLSKAMGDLAGPCTFALCMGLARAFYAKKAGRLKLSRYMAFCGVLSIGGYVLASLGVPLLGMLGCGVCGFAVGVLWPGTFSAAAAALPAGGTAMYAFLALAGDLGCASGPAAAGAVADASGGNLQPAMAFSVVFPAMLLVGIWLYRRTAERG